MTLKSKITAAAIGAGLSVGLAALLLSVPASQPAGDAFAQTKKASQNVNPAELPQITDDVDDPAVWGQEMQPTKYGGSISTPHTPTEADPRTVTSQSKVDVDAGLKAMWQGYAFAVDFREDRGHFLVT